VDGEGAMIDLGSTAVAADRMPLVLVGIAAALRLAGVVTLERCHGVGAGFDAARRLGAGYLVAGSADDAETEVLLRRLPTSDARVIALLSRVERPTLVALLDAGVSGLALRTVSAEDLASMTRSVVNGERAVAPALVSLLAGFETSLGASESAGESPLTAKEQQVLARLAQGESNAAIAQALYISTATVKSHLASIYAKLDVRTRTEATSRALALGLLH